LFDGAGGIEYQHVDLGRYGVQAVAGGYGEVRWLEFEGDYAAGSNPRGVHANGVAMFDLDFRVVLRGLRSEGGCRTKDGERADGGEELAAVPGFGVVCRVSVGLPREITSRPWVSQRASGTVEVILKAGSAKEHTIRGQRAWTPV
jgi:hypothetical protein